MNDNIWNNFAKQAIASGLLSSYAEDNDNKSEDKKDKPEKISDDAIRLLYNIEPDTIFKERDIIETAHPDSAVICRTYDAMNAIVENVNQRQDIMAYIANKMPTGNITHHRYVAARQKLINSLIKAAFTLDNEDQEDLMSLADCCARRLGDDVKEVEIEKKAFEPITIGAVAVGALALLGGAYYIFYSGNAAQNVYVNSKQVLDALQPLSSKPYASGIRDNVTKLAEMAAEVYSLKDDLATIKSIDQAIDVSQSNTDHINNIKTKINKYIEQMKMVYKVIPEWVSKIELAHSVTTESNDDWWAKIKNIADPLYDTDDEELINALWGKEKLFGSGRGGGLYEAIQKDLSVMSKAISAARQQAPKVQEAVKQKEVAINNNQQPEESSFPSFEYIVPEELR